MQLPADYILLKDALALMGKRDEYGFPVPFTIRYVKLDRKRKTGGQLVEAKATLPSRRINSKMYRNAIRHISIAGKGRVTPVHIYLITKINNKWVI
jgi:hypothetical protein